MSSSGRKRKSYGPIPLIYFGENYPLFVYGDEGFNALMETAIEDGHIPPAPRPEDSDDPEWARLCYGTKRTDHFEFVSNDESKGMLSGGEYRRIVPKSIPRPDPSTDVGWMELCVAAASERGGTETLVAAGSAAPSNDAPSWVLEATSPPPEASDRESRASYQQRLLAALRGNFVLLAVRDGKQQLVKGRPKIGVKYHWRYYDSADKSSVHEDTTQMLFRRTHNGDAERLVDDYGSLPGEFNSRKEPMWMQRRSDGDGDGSASDGDLFAINATEFWDAMWCWKFEGTTHVPIWDECLRALAVSAGILEDNKTASYEGTTHTPAFNVVAS